MNAIDALLAPLDTPSAYLRNAAVGKFDWLNPFSSEGRATGGDVLRHWGAPIDREDTWSNLLPRMGIEALLDPVNLIGGAGLVRKFLRRPTRLMRHGPLPKDIPSIQSRLASDNWLVQGKAIDELEGRAPPSHLGGRWFTNTSDDLKWYENDSVGSNDIKMASTYIDLPRREAKKFRVYNHPEALSWSRSPKTEFVLTPELANMAMPLANAPPLPKYRGGIGALLGYNAMVQPPRRSGSGIATLLEQPQDAE